MPIIAVDHVTKEFKLGQLVGLKQSLVNGLNRLVGRPVEQRMPFKALDDVSFSVEKGEVLGIIGHNGAGKSTLLKLLASISEPTSGRVSVIGKVAPLIEVGAGMVPDLTGRENIRLNCTILGIPKKEIARKFDEIVSFAELEDFIDTPIKRYSSGMKVKLGFAIATSIESEILIIDEVLAVGDLAFQRKCFDRMEEMIKRQQRTVLLVSHNIRQVERICSRVLLLEKGAVLADGKPLDICNRYYERTDAKIRQELLRSNELPRSKRFKSSGDVELLRIALLDESGKEVDTVVHDSDLTVSILLKANALLAKPNFGLGVHTTDFLYLATHQSEESFAGESVNPGRFEIRCKLRHFPFLPGVYSLRFGVAVGDMFSTIFYAENLLEFQVIATTLNRSDAMRQGFVALDAKWTMAMFDEPVPRSADVLTGAL